MNAKRLTDEELVEELEVVANTLRHHIRVARSWRRWTNDEREARLHACRAHIAAVEQAIERIERIEDE